MSYLKHILSTPKEPAVKTHTSIESLVKSLTPQFPSQPVPERKEVAVSLNEAKQLAENSLLTEREKIDIEKINEEIASDLREAFLNESVSIQEAATTRNYYKIFRDRDETFECKISVEGASLGNSTVRLVLESDSWNILFTGKIYKDGRCVVPLKKMSILPEGTVGKARLEVIIDDNIFVPWEETYIVEGSKKVTVEIKPQGKVSVNVKNDD